MSNGSTPEEAIPIVGVTTRAEIDAQEATHLDTQFGAESWVLVARSAQVHQSRTIEQVDVDDKTAGAAQVYFDITDVAVDEEGDTRGIWDDNDQRPML